MLNRLSGSERIVKIGQDLTKLSSQVDDGTVFETQCRTRMHKNKNLNWTLNQTELEPKPNRTVRRIRTELNASNEASFPSLRTVSECLIIPCHYDGSQMLWMMLAYQHLSPVLSPLSYVMIGVIEWRMHGVKRRVLWKRLKSCLFSRSFPSCFQLQQFCTPCTVV